jgi:perosamine synthetase
MKYMIAAPDLSETEIAYVNECLRTNWISSKGRFIEEFETSFAHFLHRKHAVATCNGTIALHLALLGMGIGPGDEVIVPSLTYVATANAVTYCGATPVFADSEPYSWCVSVESIARLITPKTKGIIPVHLYGHPCDMDPILDLAKANRLWVVEDCAEAQGATYAGIPVGKFGTAAMFSFFGNKIITTGEGGMVVTDDDELAERLRLLRGQGMDLSRRYWHPIIGYNFRMTNIAAAIGLGQMERASQLIADRRRIGGWYNERLKDVTALTLPPNAPRCQTVYWLYSVLVNEASGMMGEPGRIGARSAAQARRKWGNRRDALMAELAQAGIETRPFFYPIHQFPMYRDHRTDTSCPVACALSASGISLPTSSYLKEPDINLIAALLRGLLVREMAQAA